MKKKIGLIAGGGTLPREFIRTAKRQGEKVVVFAIKGMAEESMVSAADRIYWLNVGEYSKFFILLLKERIRRIAFLGKIEKNIIYEKKKYDKKGWDLMKKLDDQKDYSILSEITRRLDRIGIKVINGKEYLMHLFSNEGILSLKQADERVEADIKFGYETAKKLAAMDIGQMVVIKNKAVVAVEAMEGTDATISRADQIAGAGCVMVKVSRPDQDMRWDIPTIGPETMEKLIESKFSAIAVEKEKTFMVEKDKLLKMADENNIVVCVI